MILPYEIEKAIQESIPALAAEQLRKFITVAQANETELVRLRELKLESEESAKRFLQAEQKLADVQKREFVVGEREAKATLREAVLELREAHAKERVAELRGVLTDVFSNNRMKYTQTEHLPVSINNGGYTTMMTATKTAHQEG